MVLTHQDHLWQIHRNHAKNRDQLKGNSKSCAECKSLSAALLHFFRADHFDPRQPRCVAAFKKREKDSWMPLYLWGSTIDQELLHCQAKQPFATFKGLLKTPRQQSDWWNHSFSSFLVARPNLLWRRPSGSNLKNRLNISLKPLLCINLTQSEKHLVAFWLPATQPIVLEDWGWNLTKSMNNV